jgi:hypothetical protein
MSTQTTTPTEVDEVVFRWFTYHIIGMFAEYLNDIQQHSYNKLTDEWWLALVRELDIVNKLDDNSEEIQRSILEKVLAEFPKEFLTESQTDELKKNLEATYLSFVDMCVGPPHYCRIPGCIGDCGIQSCGICIDCCRCPMYW